MKNIILNEDCRNVVFPSGLMVSDPPYNQKYKYNLYGDNLSNQNYMELLRVFRPPCVVISYPEPTINILPKILGDCSEVVCWVYPSNTAKQSRLISWFGCKPDFRKIPQPYKNPSDKRIQKRILEGKFARGYDWWLINQVKNVSKKLINHPCILPTELLKRIIISTAQAGQCIIDPFAGVGTVLRVAESLGHPYFGTEIDKFYYEQAQRRK